MPWMGKPCSRILKKSMDSVVSRGVDDKFANVFKKDLVNAEIPVWRYIGQRPRTLRQGMGAREKYNTWLPWPSTALTISLSRRSFSSVITESRFVHPILSS